MDLVRDQKHQCRLRIKILTQQLDWERQQYKRLSSAIERECDHEWKRQYDGLELLKVCAKCGYM